MKKDKIGRFFNFLDSCSINKHEKRFMKFLVEFLQGKHDPKLSSKSILLYGPPGVGKTFLIEKFLETVELPILYAGCVNLRLKNAVKCKTLQELEKKIEKNQECIIFVDDIHFTADIKDYELCPKDSRSIMRMLEHVKKSNNKSVFLSTTNCFSELDDAAIDRIEVRIKMYEPGEKNKLDFLEKDYKKYLNDNLIDFLSVNSIGYNYRDLTEVIRLAYREGNGKISKNSLNNALKKYRPSGLSKLDVINGVKTKFRDIVGRAEIKSILKRAVYLMNNKSFCENFDIKRPNLLIFNGPPGTGKSFMARALAGEIEVPFINFGGSDFYGKFSDVFDTISDIKHCADRYKKCVIFIDDVDKLLGRSMMNIDDTPILGHLYSMLEGVEEPINGLIILAMNNIQCFGKELKSRFTVLDFNLPNSIEREDFIKMKIRKSRRHVKIRKINIAEIVRMTDGLSFRDIEKIWNDAMFHYIETKKPIDDNAFRNSIELIIKYARPDKNDLRMIG